MEYGGREMERVEGKKKVQVLRKTRGEWEGSQEEARVRKERRYAGKVVEGTARGAEAKGM